MKKREVDHVLRAAGRITGDTQFVIIGSQSLHGKFPDLPDLICVSAEVDIIAKNLPSRTEWLNVIGAASPFHEEFGYYADPVDEKTAVLPKGWRGRLVNLPEGDTEGARALCLDPHDLAISKYIAAREKDRVFTAALVQRGLLERKVLLDRLAKTSIDDAMARRVAAAIERDFAA